ncbi:unnamed protein product [Ranitomeya imitator]|uniref:Reverse transcriptase domain-containing protein n=1 Tax=Ranitomeya imitator TaxID=111125 RepID=A0ABN9KVH8_9NEOB|nr:unnamed protein product [Ranitomeya imitator]
MDVNSLYTSIRHQDGIESVMSFLSQNTGLNNHQLKFCKDLLTLILTRNFFLFEDQFYIQKKGTAMGSNVAPPYANIFMGQFKITYVYPHPSFMSHMTFSSFGLGMRRPSSLFYNDLNSCVPGLTFSINHDFKSMHFLDTMVIIKDDRNI